jgi:hypothetical protein
MSQNMVATVANKTGQLVVETTDIPLLVVMLAKDGLIDARIDQVQDRDKKFLEDKAKGVTYTPEAEAKLANLRAGIPS